MQRQRCERPKYSCDDYLKEIQCIESDEDAVDVTKQRMHHSVKLALELALDSTDGDLDLNMVSCRILNFIL